MKLPGTAVPDRAVRLPQTHLAGLRSGLSLVNGPVFRLRLTPEPGAAASAGGGGGFDDAPRSGPRATMLMRYRAEDGTPLELIAGDRFHTVSCESSLVDDWELVVAPEPIRGRKVLIGFTGQAERVSTLYPKVAELQELGGVRVTDVPVGLYPAADARMVTSGQVVDWSGEAPYEFLAELQVVNRQLVVDGRVLKIVQATPHHTVPRVALRLREATPA